jgi:TatA/E family protein of Tat protein translocase
VFDLSIPKLLVLTVIALVVFGPNELPTIASQVGRVLRDLRRVAEGAKNDLREGLGPEFADFEIEDLNPKRFVQKHLFDDLNADQKTQQPPPILSYAQTHDRGAAAAAPARDNDSMTRLHATAAHTIPERPPIRVTPGQQVQAGQPDTDWPAFVFITTDDGAGWVPERYLDTSSDPAVIVTGYDTTELATTAGEELTLIDTDDLSGWAWVRNAAGREGWVPLRTVEPLPGT